GPNAGYALELLEKGAQPQLSAAVATEPPLDANVSAAAAAAALAQSIRLFGHRAAHTDPLGSEPPGDPHLDYGAHGLTEDDLARLPASVVAGPGGASEAGSALEAIHRLE